MRPSRASQPARTVSVSVTASDERYRLHNLSPQEGSRRDNKRKGRGYGGHQVCRQHFNPTSLHAVFCLSMVQGRVPAAHASSH